MMSRTLAALALVVAVALLAAPPAAAADPGGPTGWAFTACFEDNGYSWTERGKGFDTERDAWAAIHRIRRRGSGRLVAAVVRPFGS